ncbi:MAG: DMT family transporter [Pararhizobium sp.]
MSAKSWGLLLFLGLLWGGSFFFARVAVQEIPPLTLVLLRVSLAALALHLYLRAGSGLYATLRRRWREFLILGFLNNAVPFALIFAGETAIGAGLASILNATTPLWTVIVAHLATSDEKLSTRKVAGCAIGLAGTVLLVGPDAWTGLGAPAWAQFAVLGAAVSYGFAAIYGRRFSGIPAPVTATGQMTASTAIMLPVVLLVDRPWHLAMPSADVLAMVAALAWISTAFAYILYFRIIQLAGATNASLVTLIVPPSAILLGSVFLGERLGLGEIAAMGLIAIGLLCIDGRLSPATFRRRVAAR